MKFSSICKSTTCVRKALMILCQLVFAQSAVISQDVAVDTVGIHIRTRAHMVVENINATSNASIVNHGTLQVGGNCTKAASTAISGSGTYKFTTQVAAKNRTFYAVGLDSKIAECFNVVTGINKSTTEKHGLFASCFPRQIKTVVLN